MRTIGLTQRVDFVPSYGERRDALDQRWAVLLREAGFLAVPLMNCMPGPADALDTLQLDGVILTGGNDLACVEGAANVAPERDALERSLLTLCGQRGLPVLGVCRGMQMLAVHHGARLVRVAGHVAAGHVIRVAAPLDAIYSAPVEVTCYHGFAVAVESVRPPLTPVAWAEDGAVEAVTHTLLRQVGIMWHPERRQPFRREDLALLQHLFGRSP